MTIEINLAPAPITFAVVHATTDEKRTATLVKLGAAHVIAQVEGEADAVRFNRKNGLRIGGKHVPGTGYADLQIDPATLASITGDAPVAAPAPVTPKAPRKARTPKPAQVEAPVVEAPAVEAPAVEAPVVEPIAEPPAVAEPATVEAPAVVEPVAETPAQVEAPAQVELSDELRAIAERVGSANGDTAIRNGRTSAFDPDAFEAVASIKKATDSPLLRALMSQVAAETANAKLRKPTPARETPLPTEPPTAPAVEPAPAEAPAVVEPATEADRYVVEVTDSLDRARQHLANVSDHEAKMCLAALVDAVASIAKRAAPAPRVSARTTSKAPRPAPAPRSSESSDLDAELRHRIGMQWARPLARTLMTEGGARLTSFLGGDDDAMRVLLTAKLGAQHPALDKAVTWAAGIARGYIRKVSTGEHTVSPKSKTLTAGDTSRTKAEKIGVGALVCVRTEKLSDYEDLFTGEGDHTLRVTALSGKFASAVFVTGGEGDVPRIALADLVLAG